MSWRSSGPSRWLVSAPIALSFLLAYPGGLFRFFDPLQPARYSHFVFVWGALPAGWAVARIAGSLGSRIGWPRLAAATASITVVALASNQLRDKLGGVLAGRLLIGVPLNVTHKLLLAAIQDHVKPGERILFEDRNQGIKTGENTLNDPIGGDFRLSPLIPLATGAEVIGGPYLYTHLTTNFTQFGDGRLMGKTEWSRDQFIAYCRLYDIKAIVCWSQAAREFCQQNGDLVKAVDSVRNSGGEFLIGRIAIPEEASTPTPRVGRANVKARFNRLEIEVLELKDGLVVLPYHWVPRLVAEPATTIEPVKLLDDPVPFIGLRAPPEQLLIWLEARPRIGR